MSELIKQGLEIGVLGMGLTFAALGLLIVAMIMLERLFREQDEGEEETAVLPPPPSPIDDAEIAAVIAAALAHWQAQENSSLGANLQKSPGPWWHTHGNKR